MLTATAAPQTQLWTSNTPGQPGKATMQGDGNFVITNGAGQVVFATGTNGNANCRLTLDDSGSLNLYSSTGVVIWSARRVLWPGQSIVADDPTSYLLSASGNYTLKIVNGALVILDNQNQTTWTSGTKTAATATLTSGGNFQLLDGNNNPLLGSGNNQVCWSGPRNSLTCGPLGRWREQSAACYSEAASRGPWVACSHQGGQL